MEEQIVTLLEKILAELKKVNDGLDVITYGGSLGITNILSRVDDVERAVNNVTESVGDVINEMSEKK